MSASNTKNDTKAKPKSAAETPLSFEHAFAELENIVAQMESGLPLEASLTAYTRGNMLLQFCQKSLAEVEQQVQILNDRNQLAQFKSEND